MVLGSTSLPPKPLISTRRGIAWGLDPRKEDSSVLVLTSPTRYYVDIRYALVGKPTAGPFWAFGGQVTYTALPGLDEGSGVGIRGEWNHPIDSMGNTEGVDRADLFTLDNGDQIEVGLLENPETGKEDRFMEYWTKPSSLDVSRKGANLPYTVAVLHHEEKLIGLAIRVGDFAQGIRQVVGSESGVLTARWTYESESGGWQEAAMGDGKEDDIPMRWLLAERKLDDVHFGAEQWTIVELVR
jgi:hypothetical protein